MAGMVQLRSFHPYASRSLLLYDKPECSLLALYINLALVLSSLLILLPLYNIIMQSVISTSNVPSRCRLLALPVELRLQIYEHTQHTVILRRPDTQEGNAPIDAAE